MARIVPYADTTVKAEKAIAEIEELLGVHKVSAIMKEYESGRIKALSFKMGEVPFQLPVNVVAVYQYLLSQRKTSVYDQETRNRIYDQAERCAWRNVEAWVKAQLAIVEIGMVTVLEVFMPYILTDGGETAYQLWCGERSRL